MCPLYSHMEALCVIIMNECPKFHLLITPHRLTLIVLTPLHSPYTLFADYTHLFIDYDNTYVDCINSSLTMPTNLMIV
jgi:hypothetical protein